MWCRQDSEQPLESSGITWNWRVGKKSAFRSHMYTSSELILFGTRGISLRKQTIVLKNSFQSGVITDTTFSDDSAFLIFFKLFTMEKQRTERLGDIAILLQSFWRCYIARKKFVMKKKSVTTISANYRRFAVRVSYAKILENNEVFGKCKIKVIFSLLGSQFKSQDF